MNKDLMKFVEDFDAGTPVTSVIMGGLDDGYETAIQKLAVEIMRVLMGVSVPEEKDVFVALIGTACDSAIGVLGDLGFSGAQVGAAKNLAAMYYRHTPAGALSKVGDADRLIVMVLNEDGTIGYDKQIG